MTLPFDRVGTGPLGCVFLHGFLGQRRNMSSLAATLVERDSRRSVWSFDLPGHGQAKPLHENADIDFMAKAVISSVEDSGVSQPAVGVGHSLGGRIALAAAVLKPDAFESLYLLDIGPGAIPSGARESSFILEQLVKMPDRVSTLRQMQQALEKTGISSLVAQWLTMNMERGPDGNFVWRIDRKVLATLHPRVSDQDLWPLFKSVRCPVTVVRGIHSNYVPLSEAERLRQAGARVIDVEAAHNVHLEAQDIIIDLLTQSPSGGF